MSSSYHLEGLVKKYYIERIIKMQIEKNKSSY